MDPLRRKIIRLSAYYPFKFRSVDVNLPGRLMRADRTEHDCLAYIMSAGEVSVQCSTPIGVGERIVAYLETVGRVSGQVTSASSGEFVMSIAAPSKHRDKLADKLTWLHNLNKSGIADDRSAQRFSPVHDKCQISVITGELYNCRLIDMSAGGMSVNVDLKVPVGSIVTFEDASCVVVRNFQGGIALEFVEKPSKNVIQKYFMRDVL
ncbi:MAG: PilZ domain-containing protein [Rhizobiales bacterium]|nr:PilZ domain-containing protein [Hyphomicrobiales bacterium]NRB13763.1 PilZ domain-containing protein [Hyphomicrobiales bacterium]